MVVINILGLVWCIKNYHYLTLPVISESTIKINKTAELSQQAVTIMAEYTTEEKIEQIAKTLKELIEEHNSKC